MADLIGSGRTELARAVFGADPIGDGTIWINGQRVAIYAANQQGDEGAMQALSAANLGGKVLLVSFDSSDPLNTAPQSGVVDGLVVQNPFKMGYDSLTAMVKQIRDGVKATNEDTGVTIVT